MTDIVTVSQVGLEVWTPSFASPAIKFTQSGLEVWTLSFAPIVIANARRLVNVYIM